MKDYYSVLSVDRNASTEQIRSRFLSLARERHPDLFRGEDKAKAEEEFQGITEAFNILSNPERRRQHDRELEQPESAQTRAADPQHLARVYLQRGAKAYREKKYFEAAESFDRATKVDPKNAMAWYNLAMACSHQKRWQSRAMSAIAKACELEKMNGQYFKAAGKLFAHGNMRLRAEKYYRLALQWCGEDPEILAALEELKKKK